MFVWNWKRKRVILFAIILHLHSFVFHPVYGRLNDKVLLSSIETLIFQRGKLTTGRRSSPVQQLQCNGRICSDDALPSSAMCENIGTDDAGLVAWKCSAELGQQLIFSQTDVSCEGWDSPEDPYILAGSCALVYQLKWAPGASHFGNSGANMLSHSSVRSEGNGGMVFLLLACIILAVVCVSKRAAGVQDASSYPPATVVASPVNSAQEMPLPEGWEERIDSQGRVYYFDHNTNTNSYTDPRACSVPPQHPQPPFNAQQAQGQGPRGGGGIGSAGNFLLGMALGRRLGGFGGWGRPWGLARRGWSGFNTARRFNNNGGWQQSFHAANMRPDPFGGPAFGRPRVPRAAVPSIRRTGTHSTTSFARTVNR